jgi:hypothetical protein
MVGESATGGHCLQLATAFQQLFADKYYCYVAAAREIRTTPFDISAELEKYPHSHMALVFPFHNVQCATDYGYVIVDPGCLFFRPIVVRYEAHSVLAFDSKSYHFNLVPLPSLAAQFLPVPIDLHDDNSRPYPHRTIRAIERQSVMEDTTQILETRNQQMVYFETQPYDQKKRIDVVHSIFTGSRFVLSRRDRGKLTLACTIQKPGI